MTEPGATIQAGTTQDQAKSFFSKLFDFSFNEFITLSLIKLLYIILVGASALGALFIFIAMATQGGAMIVVGLILAPIVFIVYVILVRVWLEVLIVAFRIADNIAELVRQGRLRG
jgi:hypothetical protein